MRGVKGSKGKQVQPTLDRDAYAALGRLARIEQVSLAAACRFVIALGLREYDRLAEAAGTPTCLA